jgi:uncharacterized membrane protein
MRTTYNQVAGQSVKRLAALSDGVFAGAMTLLVLDLPAPAIHSEQDLGGALTAMGPPSPMYGTGFLTLRIFWVGQQAQLNQLDRSERSLSWIHLVFMFAVPLTPFSTTLRAELIEFRIALLLYWANIFLLGAILVRDDLTAETIAALRLRWPGRRR